MSNWRQGESLSPFLFALYVNDIEEEFIIKGANGIGVGYLKIISAFICKRYRCIFRLTRRFTESLDILFEYCYKWKLTVNIDKSKVMIFRKGGRISDDLSFIYGDMEMEIVSKYTYLGIVFTSGGSFNVAQKLCQIKL